MNVEIRAEVALVPEKEYIKGTFVALHYPKSASIRKQNRLCSFFYLNLEGSSWLKSRLFSAVSLQVGGQSPELMGQIKEKVVCGLADERNR
jgi:hypothetical protein